MSASQRFDPVVVLRALASSYATIVSVALVRWAASRRWILVAFVIVMWSIGGVVWGFGHRDLAVVFDVPGLLLAGLIGAAFRESFDERRRKRQSSADWA